MKPTEGNRILHFFPRSDSSFVFYEVLSLIVSIRGEVRICIDLFTYLSVKFSLCFFVLVFYEREER